MLLPSARRPLVVAACACSMILVLSGCTDLRLRSLTPSTGEAQPSAFEELTREQQMALSEVLEGEVQTVYASDTGLARVYGQVANFGDEVYAAVQFQVVADLKVEGDAGSGAVSEDSQVSRVVGTFVVADLAPGDIENFDVQTTVKTGEARALRVEVSGVR